MAELFILGTSGQAKETAQLARLIDPHGDRWPVIAYVAQREADLGASLPHGRVSHTDASFEASFDATASRREVAIGVGHPRLRRRLAERIASRYPSCAFPNLVRPGVILHPEHLHMGVGNLVSHGVVLTVDITIGDFTLLNFQSTVGHDAVIGSWSVVNPSANISGGCVIGDECLIGVGAQILEGRRVCSGAVVGAGAVVTRDITEPGTYVGVPARRIR